MKRNRFSLRQKTKMSQKLPLDEGESEFFHFHKGSYMILRGLKLQKLGCYLYMDMSEMPSFLMKNLGCYLNTGVTYTRAITVDLASKPNKGYSHL